MNSILEAQLNKGRPELFYQHGPTLMQTIPKRFIDSLMKQKRLLSPLKMIPSLLVNARSDQELEAIRYLEFCVNKLENKDAPVHNYLISLYIKHQPTEVWPYLQKFSDTENIIYDVRYVLRLCCEKPDMHREAVYLFCVLGQLGMISHKKSLITIFVTSILGKNCIKILTVFNFMKKFHQKFSFIFGMKLQILKQNYFENEGIFF